MDSSQSRNRPGPIDQRQIGRLGELWVACCLEDRGYRILGRNVRLERDEIDIVAQHGDELLFVEVKTRRSARVAPPEAAIDQRKRRAMERAAHRYLARYAGGSRPIGAGSRGSASAPAWSGAARTLLVVASVLLEAPGSLPRIRYQRTWPPLQ